MLKILTTIAVVLYFLVGVLQLFAIAAGFEYFFGLWFLIALVAAFFLTYIPGVGLVAGIYGATAVWGWDFLSALILFGFPTFLWLAAITVSWVWYGNE